MEAMALATNRQARTSANPTFTTAKKLPDWPDWNEAIAKELQMLDDLGCFEQIRRHEVATDPATGRKHQVIPCKIDLKLKYDAKGHPTKHKARLVVLGNQEWPTIREVFSPTVNSKTINLLLALAAQQGLTLYGLDIFGAFITADIDGPVYVQLPPGLVPPDIDGNSPIWRLRRTLYGLNRAPKAFYDQLTAFLLTGHYNRSINDPCLFFRLYSDGRRIYFCIHVDDFAIAASDNELIAELCDHLKQRYTITESDNLESFLGIHIVQEDGRLYLSQPGHIAKCAKAAGITPTSKPTYIPLSPTFSDEEQDQAPPADKSAYATLLGMLIFVLRTRPDVAFAVNRLATRAAQATEKDMVALRQVASYLYTTAHLELVYNSANPEQRTTVAQLYAYSDAAYLAHTDSKSHSGLNFTLGQNTGVFHARSQKQKIVTLSSTEAEIYAAIESVKDIVFFRDILKELGYEQFEPTSLFIDNKSAITLGQAVSGHQHKVRHFMGRLRYLIEQVEAKVVRLEHMSGDIHPSDVLTKAKPRPGHEQNVRTLMGPQRDGAEERLKQIQQPPPDVP
jgi:hypothetical protein